MSINWDEFRCRCSGIHKIMANPRSNPQLTEKQALRLEELEARETLTAKHKEELSLLLVKKGNRSKLTLSASCISYLMEVYAWEKYGMISFGKEVYEVEQLQKGKLAENESIMLLSMLDDRYYTKNEERISNDFLSGHPDIFLGDNIMNALKIIDIKTSFDYPSFLQKLHDELPNAYILQVKGYCDITGATEGEISHCLSDMPEIIVNDFKKKLFFKMEVATEENPDFKEKWEIMERSMRFGNIPIRQRVFKQKVEPFTELEREQVYDRVKFCREWLWNFSEKYESVEKLVPLMQTDAK